MDVKEKIASRIREIREEQGLTQEELAWKSDVNRTSMNHIENGRRNISVETLDKIVNGLDVTLSEFFDSSLFRNEKRRKKQ